VIQRSIALPLQAFSHDSVELVLSLRLSQKRRKLAAQLLKVLSSGINLNLGAVDKRDTQRGAAVIAFFELDLVFGELLPSLRSTRSPAPFAIRVAGSCPNSRAQGDRCRPAGLTLPVSTATRSCLHQPRGIEANCPPSKGNGWPRATASPSNSCKRYNAGPQLTVGPMLADRPHS
jgi:hypothetical protein